MTYPAADEREDSPPTIRVPYLKQRAFVEEYRKAMGFQTTSSAAGAIIAEFEKEWRLAAQAQAPISGGGK